MFVAAAARVEEQRDELLCACVCLCRCCLCLCRCCVERGLLSVCVYSCAQVRSVVRVVALTKAAAEHTSV